MGRFYVMKAFKKMIPFGSENGNIKQYSVHSVSELQSHMGLQYP